MRTSKHRSATYQRIGHTLNAICEKDKYQSQTMQNKDSEIKKRGGGG